MTSSRIRHMLSHPTWPARAPSSQLKLPKKLANGWAKSQCRDPFLLKKKTLVGSSDREDFWALAVEILVFASPTGHILTSSGFPLVEWGIFYKFLQHGW